MSEQKNNQQAQPEQDLNQQRKVRREKLAALQEAGQDPFQQTRFDWDAEYLAQQLKEKCGVKEVVISYVGAVIGSHSGPGTLALFFLGTHR